MGGVVPILSKKEKERKEEGATDLSAIKAGIEKISSMMTKYMVEVERRLEVIEKMFFSLQRAVDDIEGRVSLIEKKMEESVTEEKAIKIPSSLVEDAGRKASSVEHVEEAAHDYSNNTKEKKAMEEEIEEDEWKVAEEKGFTSVIDEFKKLLDEE